MSSGRGENYFDDEVEPNKHEKVNDAALPTKKTASESFFILDTAFRRCGLQYPRRLSEHELDKKAKQYQNSQEFMDLYDDVSKEEAAKVIERYKKSIAYARDYNAGNISMLILIILCAATLICTMIIMATTQYTSVVGCVAILGIPFVIVSSVILIKDLLWTVKISAEDIRGNARLEALFNPSEKQPVSAVATYSDATHRKRLSNARQRRFDVGYNRYMQGDKNDDGETKYKGISEKEIKHRSKKYDIDYNDIDNVATPAQVQDKVLSKGPDNKSDIIPA